MASWEMPPLHGESTRRKARKIEVREWWLWGSAITVTLLLTGGIASFLLPFLLPQSDSFSQLNFRVAVHGLVASVLLFDLYTIYQQLQIHRTRRRLAESDELFRLISENAADMIAVVDMEGNRLYNSPAYYKVLGYSPGELALTSAFEQIHPGDRQKVEQAAEESRRTGEGRELEYRMRHKDGSWRVLQSAASVIRNAKGEPDKLVIVNRDITARKHAEERLAHNAFHDALTGLPNRVLLLDRMQRAFRHAQRHSEYCFAVLFIDIDNFKKFNDNFGPTAGDQAIIEVGRRLSVCLQLHDVTAAAPGKANGDHTLARLSGDEFCILLDDIKDPSEAIRLATRIQESLSMPFHFDGHEIFTSASVGIALSTEHNTADNVIRDADIAMYRAKSLGKARCEVFDNGMHARAVDRLKLETELRRALDRCEFRNYYQPIVSLATGRLAGLETLARWEHPQLGLVMPDRFIEVADETGLIIAINRWLMRAACERAWSWHLRYPSHPDLLITANITSRQFADPNLPKDLELMLRDTRLPPQFLQLEITETVAMSDADRASRVLSSLKDLGVGLCIDDFGTGYSSLSRLQRFPVDKLKIDRSFIRNLEHNADNREVVRIIITLAHHFHMTVVAEGTETAEQVKYLHELGCEFAQGYYFSRPLDENGVERMLTAEAPLSEPRSRKDVSLIRL